MEIEKLKLFNYTIVRNAMTAQNGDRTNFIHYVNLSVKGGKGGLIFDLGKNE